ncbi:Uncharacterised protein [uncultured archaeon]|nr:Uncharacterised protein [uncultured archaeon]
MNNRLTHAPDGNSARRPEPFRKNSPAEEPRAVRASEFEKIELRLMPLMERLVEIKGMEKRFSEGASLLARSVFTKCEGSGMDFFSFATVHVQKQAGGTLALSEPEVLGMMREAVRERLYAGTQDGGDPGLFTCRLASGPVLEFSLSLDTARIVESGIFADVLHEARRLAELDGKLALSQEALHRECREAASHFREGEPIFFFDFAISVARSEGNSGVKSVANRVLDGWNGHLRSDVIEAFAGLVPSPIPTPQGWHERVAKGIGHMFDSARGDGGTYAHLERLKAFHKRFKEYCRSSVAGSMSHTLNDMARRIGMLLEQDGCRNCMSQKAVKEIAAELFDKSAKDAGIQLEIGGLEAVVVDQSGGFYEDMVKAVYSEVRERIKAERARAEKPAALRAQEPSSPPQVEKPRKIRVQAQREPTLRELFMDAMQGPELAGAPKGRICDLLAKLANNNGVGQGDTHLAPWLLLEAINSCRKKETKGWLRKLSARMPA